MFIHFSCAMCSLYNYHYFSSLYLICELQFLHMFACVVCVYASTHVCMFVGVCVGASIWEPKVDVGSLPLLLSTLFTEV